MVLNTTRDFYKVAFGGIAVYTRRGRSLWVEIRIRNLARRWISETCNITSGYWFHVASTWRINGELRVYLNGTEVSTTESESYTPGYPVLSR